MSFDYIEDMASLEEWFEENEECFIVPYIEQHFKQVSWYYQLDYMRQHLFFSKKIIEDYSNSNEAKINILLKSLVHSDSNQGKIVLVDGSMGGGKTGFGCFILDEYYKLRPNLNFFFVTKSETKPQLPNWIKIVEDVNSVENNSIALVDEGAIQLSSRRSMTKENSEASERLVKLRQKGITLIILVQNIKMVDANVRRLASIRVLKFGIKFGDEQGDTTEDVKEIRNRLKPRDVNEAYFEIIAYGRYYNIKHGLPEWWDDTKVSKYMKDWQEKKKESMPLPINSNKRKKICGVS